MRRIRSITQDSFVYLSMLFRSLVLCLIPVIFALTPAAAHAANKNAAAINPDAIVRKAVALQLANDQQTPAVRFTYTKASPHGIFIKDVIQTQGGEVSRLVSINGHALSAERNAQEQQRLDALLSHPSDQARHRRHELEDQGHIDRLIQELPDAFLFTFAGTEPGPNGSMLRFTFVPNPGYIPTNIESRAFAGMTGSIWIDQTSLHFVKLNAHLIHPIRVGWGIVANFNQGGTLSLVNQSVGRDDWVITHLKLDVDGTALIFKPIHIHTTEDESNFQFLPPGTTWQQAVSMLSNEQH